MAKSSPDVKPSLLGIPSGSRIITPDQERLYKAARVVSDNIVDEAVEGIFDPNNSDGPLPRWFEDWDRAKAIQLAVALRNKIEAVETAQHLSKFELLIGANEPYSHLVRKHLVHSDAPTLHVSQFESVQPTQIPELFWVNMPGAAAHQFSVIGRGVLLPRNALSGLPKQISLPRRPLRT